jgi:hypothetical protein
MNVALADSDKPLKAQDLNRLVEMFPTVSPTSDQFASHLPQLESQRTTRTGPQNETQECGGLLRVKKKDRAAPAPQPVQE